MAARQPRRRRRSVPAAALPRPASAVAPGTDQAAPAPAPAAAPRRRGPVMREHHVTTDYSYVRKDLLLVTGVGIVTLGFVVAMSFVV